MRPRTNGAEASVSVCVYVWPGGGYLAKSSHLSGRKPEPTQTTQLFTCVEQVHGKRVPPRSLCSDAWVASAVRVTYSV